ncbi:unnamed protein product, partial [Chrysoparadoxa australica]
MSPSSSQPSLPPASSLPVVDLSSPDAHQVLVEACRTTGFFYLAGHGVSLDLMNAMFSQSAKFFAQPQVFKDKYLPEKNNRGYTAMFEETLDPSNQTIGDTKEGYYIFRDITEAELEEERISNPLAALNKWPDEESLPGWQATMKDYYNAMSSLGQRTTRVLARGLGLEEDFFGCCFTKSLSSLRLLHYKDQRSAPEKGVLGCGAHTDYGLLTFLATDDQPGLEICVNGSWIDVPPRRPGGKGITGLNRPLISGMLVVNIGDMLERWTNGVLRSTLHRVCNKTGCERLSAPFFLDPNFDTIVTAIPKFVSRDRPALFPPTTSGQHLREKYLQVRQKTKAPAPPPYHLLLLPSVLPSRPTGTLPHKVKKMRVREYTKC